MESEDTKFVNVYELSQAYGGPEEGGWWVNCGSLITSRQVPAGDAERVQAELSEEYPSAQKQRVDRLLDGYEEGVRYAPIYRYTDVNYYGGDYRVYIEDVPGADFPEVFPRYE